MFTFDAIEKSLYNGVSPDRVPNSIKNRFSMVFGYDLLDNRLLLKISKRQIQFFYYDHDYVEWNPNIVKDDDFFKEVGFITLTRPKDTGNDILTFPQNIHDLDLCYECLNSMQECLDCFRKVFFSFPFVDDYKSGTNNIIGQQCCWQNCSQETKIYVFRCFMQCCLLNFVYEFENRSQSFGAYLEYDNIRDLLRESDVYKLLSSKIHYTQYLYKDKFVPRNQEKYTYYAQKYADRLMDENFNKVVPPECFWGKKEERQGWFYNPEEELERILVKNRRQYKEQDAATLKNSLVSKIQSFMYSRHAIGKAMTKCCSKFYFWIAQAMMVIGNIIIVTSALGFKEDNWAWYYDGIEWLFVWGLIVAAFVVLSGYENRNCANALLPRILVAEATAWLTIGIAEDLVKSMLWIDNNLFFNIMLVLVMGLLIYIIYGESKQHSPYLRWNYNLGKTALIINHSLFFALSFGCAMQFFFYNNFLENSDALATVVYKKHFDKTEKYLHQLESLEKSINDYGQFVREYAFNTVGFNGISKNKSNIGGHFFYDGESMELSLENVVRSEFDISKKSVDKMPEYHNISLLNIKDNIELIDSIINSVIDTTNNCFVSKNDFGCYIEYSNNVIQIIDGDVNSDSIMQRNRQWLFFYVAPRLKKEILEVRNHLMNDDYNTLIEWAAYDKKKEMTPVKGYINSIMREDQEFVKCCVKLDNSLTSQTYFFPNLLLLHTLVVLFLAFITQLIISGKSITEPI